MAMKFMKSILKFSLRLFIELPLHVTTKEQWKRENKYTDNPHVFAKCFDDLGCIDVNEKWYDDVYRRVNLEPLDRHTIRTEFLLMKSPKGSSKEVLYDILTLKTETVDISGFKKGACTKFLIHDFTSNGHTGWIKLDSGQAFLFVHGRKCVIRLGEIIRPHHVPEYDSEHFIVLGNKLLPLNLLPDKREIIKIPWESKHLAIAFSNKSDCNVISIDWEAGAEPPFDQAIANARVVALETEVFIKMLKKHVSLTESNIHLVGHGVGAHIAGYVGKSLPGIDRITGLDPTGPSFEKMPAPVRLDMADASYVEVLHTDAFHGKSHGTLDALGHADFYLNNAAHQPGCNDSFSFGRFTTITRDLLQEGQILPACSHKRAFKYYINSIEEQDCKFIGISCEDYNHFVNGSCTNCETQVCAIFGLDKPSLKEKQTKFYLNTDADPPFCMYTYQVIVSCLNDTNSKKVMGSFNFMFVDENKKVSFATAALDNSAQCAFEPGKSHTLIVYAPPPKVDAIQEAKVKWICHRKPFGLCTSSIYVKDITIKRISLSHETTTAANLCPEIGNELTSNYFIQFTKCCMTTTAAATMPPTASTSLSTTVRTNPSKITTTTNTTSVATATAATTTTSAKTAATTTAATTAATTTAAAITAAATTVAATTTAAKTTTTTRTTTTSQTTSTTPEGSTTEFPYCDEDP